MSTSTSRPAKYSIWCERAVTLAGRARNRSLLASVCYIVNWNKCLTSVNCRLARITTRVLIYRRSFDTTRIAIRDDLAARSPSTRPRYAIRNRNSRSSIRLLHANNACAVRATAAVPSIVTVRVQSLYKGLMHDG